MGTASECLDVKNYKRRLNPSVNFIIITIIYVHADCMTEIKLPTVTKSTLSTIMATRVSN